jgi:hypothetical protein
VLTRFGQHAGNAQSTSPCPIWVGWHLIRSGTLMLYQTTYRSTLARQYLRATAFAVSLGVGVGGAAAQQSAGPQSAPAVRLVSSEQGRKIAAAAVQQDEPVRGAQDCSHLVHQIYSDAGYEYPYASSFDLYAGNGNFRRVKHAQAGDLVTWPGHVGIVLDPKRHLFYSLVRSGLQSEDYQGPYWRSRGRPRFYRYVLANAGVETASAASSPHRGESSPHRSSAATSEMRAKAEEAVGTATTEEASMRSAVAASRVPANAAISEGSPASILLTPEQRRPTSAEAYDKILELSSPAETVLRTAEPFQVNTPIVIFDELRVERIETKRDRGWVHLQVESHVRIAEGGLDFKRTHEKTRWELRREATGWTLIAPTDRSYLTRDVAVRELAANLAEMSQSQAAGKHDENVIAQEARIANLLSALLQQ